MSEATYQEGREMNGEKLKNIADMIKKECQRESLVDLCEYWEVTTDEFYEFLNLAMSAAVEQEGT